MENYSGKGSQANGSVYVCNLPEGTDENMLAEYFGTIGLLKKDKRTGRPKIWLYRDKVTNEPKGDATVTYEDPHAAFAAVDWFNNKDFHGNIIGVHIAESKSKDDQPYNFGGDPNVVGDYGEMEENAQDGNGDGGRGRGRGDASGKAWQQEGDWMCPNTRGGRGGGYKELDEEELEETKRRRKEAEEDDGEMYDEFGNLKKKFRAKTQQAETGRTLPGAGRAGWDVEELGVIERGGRERSRDRGRDRDDGEGGRNRERDDRERRRSRSRERDRGRNRDRDYGGGHDRDRDYGRDRDRDWDRDRNRHRY